MFKNERIRIFDRSMIFLKSSKLFTPAVPPSQHVVTRRQAMMIFDDSLSHLQDLVPGYFSRRENLMALASVIAGEAGNEGACGGTGGADSF